MASLPERHYLTPLFEPASVAVIGATERARAVGAVLVRNLLEAKYRGALFGVNPKYRAVHGVPCYGAIGKVPQRVDLAVIATPAATVPGIVEQCGKAGVRAAVVISAGFSEAGPAGAKLERAMLENARRHRLRVVGPNCLGLMRPELGLNATFARGAALPGALGLVAQSGAVCTAMLDWAHPNGVGFSSVVSLGGSTDVDFGEIIDYLIEDPRTEHILLYIEGVRSARRFVSALRAAARVKPVIVMKVGRHPAGSRAAVSHTGAIVGLDDVFDAVVKRAGVVRVATIGQMVAAAQALSVRVRPQGDRLAVVTNGGGPGVMAADRAADLGIPLAQLAAGTFEALKPALPAHWSHGNPLDLIGDADAARYRAAVSACLADEGVDGVLAILTPQAMTEPTAAAQAVIDAAKGSSKPVLACWMGEEQTACARRTIGSTVTPLMRASGRRRLASSTIFCQVSCTACALATFRRTPDTSLLCVICGESIFIATGNPVSPATSMASCGERVTTVFAIGMRKAASSALDSISESTSRRSASAASTMARAVARSGAPCAATGPGVCSSARWLR